MMAMVTITTKQTIDVVINRCDYQTRERCIKLWPQDRGGKNTGAGVSRESTTFIL